MKELKFENGGRPVANDDFVTLQTELTDAVQAQFQAIGPCVVSGCLVSGPASGATVTAGIVLLDGRLLRFYGQSGVALPAQFQASPYALTDARAYQTGGTKKCMQEIVPVLVASNPGYAGGQFLPVDTYGALTYWHRVQEKTRSKDAVEWCASVTTADYDSDGLGKPGSAAWGWGLCDGQGGRADLRGAFMAGYDPADAAFAVGSTGGAATMKLGVQHLPPHKHGTAASNAGGTGGNTLAKSSADTGGTLDFPSKETGGWESFSILPPFYVLAARQWVGY